MVSHIIPAALFIFWAGFVCSISFMEAWLKFQAPGVTRPIGLSIGSRVFRALNRMEWVFLLIITTLLVFSASSIPGNSALFMAIPVVILTMQTFFLLPRLDRRAREIIEGRDVEKSWLHLFFIISEVVKVIFLISLGLLLPL